MDEVISCLAMSLLSDIYFHLAMVVSNEAGVTASVYKPSNIKNIDVLYNNVIKR